MRAEQSRAEQSRSKRISGITYLKAFLPFMVIGCHVNPFGKSATMLQPLENYPDWIDIFYRNIFTLAVPLFFTISFYLYLLKRDRVNYSGFKLMRNRVCYFLLVFLIWRIIYAVFGIGNVWISDRGTARNIYHLVFGGGDTLLYYLELSAYFILLLEVMCFITEKMKIHKDILPVMGLLLSCLLMVFLHIFCA